jgi:Uma2 family endonuclease
LTLAILGIHPNEIFTLDSENLLIINKGNWEAYWTLANEDLKVEFIEERIYIHSPASLTHERIFRELLNKISNFAEKNQLGEILGSRFPIQLIEGKRAETDLVFLSTKAQTEGQLTNTFYKGSPTWIIEIISPSYREHDTITKRNQYRLLNVQEYWIIDPEMKTVEIIHFKDQIEINSRIVSSKTIKPEIEGFSTFSIDIDKIFGL